LTFYWAYLRLENFSESVIETGNFYDGREQQGVVAGNFALSFSLLNFLRIFLDISGSIQPITLIWASLERCFPPAQVEYR